MVGRRGNSMLRPLPNYGTLWLHNGDADDDDDDDDVTLLNNEARNNSFCW